MALAQATAPGAAPAPGTAPAGKPATTKPAAKPRKPDDAITPVAKGLPQHAQFLEEIKKGPFDLLLLGDSITRGWPNSGKSSYAKLAVYKPLDLGISGDRTEHVLWRITHGELDGISPKVTVIMIGTNNIGGDKPEWIAAGVAKIVATVHEKLPETKVLLLGIFPRNAKASPQRANVAAVNAIISKLDDGKKTFYLDIGEKFLDGNGELSIKIMADGLHPSGRGYDIWYDAMQPKLAELMK